MRSDATAHQGFPFERSLAAIGVRLVWPAIYLEGVVRRNRAALAAVEPDEDEPYERVASWWPKFAHRFIPAEERWHQDSSRTVREDETAGAMFAQILTARNELSAQVNDCLIGGSIGGTMKSTLLDRAEVLVARMNAFVAMAQERSAVPSGRGTVWTEEVDAW